MRPKHKRHVWMLVCLSLVFLSIQAQSKTLFVRCNSSGGLSSISAALGLLSSHDSNTIIVSGRCRENVFIFGVNRLSLIARPGVSIEDASGGTGFVVQIEDSKDVLLQGFRISGGQLGVFCVNFSVCRFVDNTIEGGSNGGVQVVYSRASFDGNNVIQHNFFGVTSLNTSLVVLNPGTIIRQNDSSGIVLDSGGSVTAANVTIENNAAVVSNSSGIESVSDGHLSVRGSTISGNGGFGVTVLGHSVAGFGADNVVTGNPLGGVIVRDLSYAAFEPGNVITGNANGDVVCFPQFPATRGALTNIGGGTTNCTEP